MFTYASPTSERERVPKRDWAGDASHCSKAASKANTHSAPEPSRRDVFIQLNIYTQTALSQNSGSQFSKILMRITLSFFISSLLAAVSLLWALLADFMIWEMNYRDPGAFFPFAMIDTLMNLGALCLSIILAVLAFIHRTSDGKWIAIPFIISCIALTVKMLGLSTSWWLEYNYSRLDAARSEFARTVAATPPKQSSENFYDNTLSYPHGQMLSIGDGPVYYKITGRGPLLLYVTFEGIPDGLSGFLYVPPGSDPKVTWPELQLDWADKWNTNGSVYFVGNR